MSDSSWMARERGNYVTKVTSVTPPNTGIVKILDGNPRRWYLRIDTTSGASGTASVAPEPVPAGVSTLPAVRMPIEQKFRDAPSLCTGEWYVSNAAIQTFLIWESIYTGE